MINIKNWIYITKIYLKDNKIEIDYGLYFILVYLFPIWIILYNIIEKEKIRFFEFWNRYLFLSILFILSYLIIYYFINDIKYIIIYNIIQYISCYIYFNICNIIDFYKSGGLNKKQMRKVKINSI